MAEGEEGREEEGERRERRESRLILKWKGCRFRSSWTQVSRGPGCLCPSLGSVSAGLSFSGLLTALMGGEHPADSSQEHHGPATESSCPDLDFMPILRPVGDEKWGASWDPQGTRLPGSLKGL